MRSGGSTVSLSRIESSKRSKAVARGLRKWGSHFDQRAKQLVSVANPKHDLHPKNTGGSEHRRIQKRECAWVYP